jgi:hypothetical protein
MTDNNKNKLVYEDTLYTIPRYIRRLCTKNLVFIDVYEAMFQFWNKGRPCFLSNDALAERANCTTRQVRNALAFFEENQELRRESRGLKRFLINPESKIETNIVQEGSAVPPSTNIAQGGSTVPQGWNSSSSQGGSTVPVEYKEEVEDIEVKKEKNENPQNTELAIIRKSNPLAAFLPDKYLLMQKQLTIQCLSDEKAYELFESKFGRLEVTFEEMLYECVMYYALKPEAQNVSNHRFIAWIKREKVEVYDKKPDSVAHKLYRDLTEQEKSLVSDYMHFKKYPDLQHRMTDSQKKQAQELLDLLKSTQNLRAI